MGRTPGKVRQKPKDHVRYDQDVQLDVDDPYNDRINSRGNRRLSLNATERALLNERELINKAIVLLIETGSVGEVLAGVPDLDDETLRRAMIGENYPEMRRATVEKLVEMYLDREPKTRKDMEQALGLSRGQLNRLIKLPEFEEAYNQAFLDMRSNPMIRATQEKLVEDLLPKSMEVVSNLLEEGPATVKAKLALKIWDKAGIRPIDTQVNDRQEAATHLAQYNIQNLNVNVPIPREYSEALGSISDVEIVDVPAIELDAPDDEPLDSTDETP